MTWTLCLAVAFVFLYTLLRAIVLEKDTFATIRWLEKEQAPTIGGEFPQDLDDLPFIILLLAVLREQRELPGLLAHILDMQYPLNKLKVLVITTERERAERGLDKGAGALTTIEVAREVSRLLNSQLEYELFVHVHCPYSDSNKASQLNFALNTLEQCVGPQCPQRAYVGVYDADSRPDKRTLTFVGLDAAASARQCLEMPPAYQQVSLYVKNFQSLPGNLEGLLLRAEALYQTRWAIGYEIPNYRSQYELFAAHPRCLIERMFKSRLSYCIGHGDFFRLDVLRSVGGFPTYSPTEDLSLGNILSILGIPVKPIPFFDVCEVPESLSSLFRQSSLWFAASMTIFSTVSFVRSKLSDTLETWRVISLVLQRTFMHFTWGLGGIVFIASLIATLCMPASLRLPLLSLGIIAGLSYSALALGTMFMLRGPLSSLVDYADDWTVIGGRDLGLLILASPCKAITNCVGPIRYVLQWLLARVVRRPVEFAKTERTIGQSSSWKESPSEIPELETRQFAVETVDRRTDLSEDSCNNQTTAS